MTALALTVSEAAAAQARDILADRGMLDSGGLRLFVTGGPLGGYHYGLAVTKRIDEGDLVVERSGVRVVVDIGSAELLAGSEVDYVDDGDITGFTILNPAGLHVCGHVA